MNFSKIVDNKIKIIAVKDTDLMKYKGIKINNPTIDTIENALDLAEDSKIEFIYLTGKIPKEVSQYYTFLDNYVQENKVKDIKDNIMYVNFSQNKKTFNSDTEAVILPLRKN